MNALIDAALSHSRSVLTGLVLLLIGGVIAYNGMPKESDPDVNIPIIYVSLSLEGISPEDAERLLLRPMEQELKQVEGVKEMSSTAYQGGGNVTLEFDAGFDADKALEDVRAKVDLAKPELPDEADEPSVNEVNLSLFPILVVSLHGDVPERTLLKVARDLRTKIEAIDAVLSVNIAGNREELVELVIDPLRMEAYGLNFDDIAAIVGRSNRLVAAGTMDTGQGRFAVKVPGLFETSRDILDLPIKVNGDAVVHVRDIASLRRTYKDAESLARLDGKLAVGLEVSKRSGENIIETVEAVRALVEAERAFWPATLEVSYGADQSDDIRLMLSDLENNLISAVLLVMIVVIGALGLRSGLIVGVAIPGSFLIGILGLASFGVTINVVVLFSLILGAGMLVDAAIVMTEFADRKMAEGLNKRDAYGLAAKRMAWPIIAATLTTIAAFLPLVFWPGVTGEFMKFLPITLSAILAASLLMGIVFLPALGAQVGKVGSGDRSRLAALARSEDSDLRALKGATGLYVRFLDGALTHAGKVVIAALAVLIGVQVLFGAVGKGVEFFPDVEPRSVIVQVHGRGNMALAEKDRLVAQVEEALLQIDRERGEFASVFAVTLAGSAGSDQQLAEDTIGTIRIEFEPWDQRRTADEIAEEIRADTAPLAGIAIEIAKEQGGPPVGKPIQVELSSRFPELLAPAIAELRAALEAMPGLVDVEDSRPIPGLEWELAVDRAEAAKFGVDVTSVGEAIQLVTKGAVFGSFRPDDSDDEIDIVARYPESYRNIDELDNMRLATADGQVPISNFVTRIAQPKVGLINRIDGRRVLSVKADVAPGVLVDQKVQEIQAWLADHPLDPDISVVFKGEDEEQREAQDFLSKAFLAALFLIAIILLTQFNSFYSMALICSAIIMSTVGVMIGHIVTGQPFGIVMSGIGVIALAGIVVNNNIILIDAFDQLRALENNPRDAILRACAQRLRPVMLTTVTTILGLLPMMFSMNIDFWARTVSIGAPSTQWWTQLSTAIVFGLTFATLLTLLVTPCSLMVREKWRGWRARRRQNRPAPAAAE